ncbi:hypothetical protein BofuT4_P050230.1 [Botrytis cinerea T4]|uniref:Uncharacterized protein n=1 Tax=Botryotinia fuckeliana (strain T4) TaxID=999810 RepID=G2XZW8_BOTF4|nr:hypothetical protein BofuT4_P050230.1 [Botrytis cinerea T4]
MAFSSFLVLLYVARVSVAGFNSGLSHNGVSSAFEKAGSD